VEITCVTVCATAEGNPLSIVVVVVVVVRSTDEPPPLDDEELLLEDEELEEEAEVTVPVSEGPPPPHPATTVTSIESDASQVLRVIGESPSALVVAHSDTRTQAITFLVMSCNLRWRPEYARGFKINQAFI
jgi:hypothetical protein